MNNKEKTITLQVCNFPITDTTMSIELDSDDLSKALIHYDYTDGFKVTTSWNNIQNIDLLPDPNKIVITKNYIKLLDFIRNHLNLLKSYPEYNYYIKINGTYTTYHLLTDKSKWLVTSIELIKLDKDKRKAKYDKFNYDYLKSNDFVKEKSS